MQKNQLIARKPAYRHGQLLLEDDFIDEQKFHSEALRRHARHQHGFGVVHGLDVSRAGEMAITVSAGFAVDRQGHEIELREPETLEIIGLPAGALAWVTLGYRHERGAGEDNRIDCYAHVRVATGVERDDVRLARLQIDERGRLVHTAINHQERDHLHQGPLAASVAVEAVEAVLRSDWIAMAFHPTATALDEKEPQPPFRVGTTEARAARFTADGKEPNLRGAAGSMALALPPGIRHIHKIRVAGAVNEKTMTVRLVKGGFDPNEMKHVRDEVLMFEVEPGPYLRTVDIPESHRNMRDRHRTLSVDIRASGYASVSLVALEVSY